MDHHIVEQTVSDGGNRTSGSRPHSVTPEQPVAETEIQSGNRIIGNRPYTPTGEYDGLTGVMRTVTANDGGRQRGPVQSDSRITVGGIELTVQQAVDHGLVSFEDGKVTELDADPLDQPQDEQDDQQEHLEALGLEPEHLEALDNWSGAIQEFTGSEAAATQVLATFINNPSELPGLMMTMAAEEGLDHNNLYSEMFAVGQAIETQTNEYISSKGIEDIDGFWEAVRSSEGDGAVNNAFIALLRGNDMSQIDSFVDQYNRHQGPDNDEVKAFNVDGKIIHTTVRVAKAKGWL